MMDVALVPTEEGIDIQLNSDESDLLNEPGLETAVIISIFSERRVTEEELPDGETDKRGWWGDLLSDVQGDQIGSKLWTKRRAKATIANKLAIKEALRNCLLWMIEDGLASSVEVDASFPKPSEILLKVDIQRPSGKNERYALVWDGQSIKRG